MRGRAENRSETPARSMVKRNSNCSSSQHEVHHAQHFKCIISFDPQIPLRGKYCHYLHFQDETETQSGLSESATATQQVPLGIRTDT